MSVLTEKEQMRIEARADLNRYYKDRVEAVEAIQSIKAHMNRIAILRKYIEIHTIPANEIRGYKIEFNLERLQLIAEEELHEWKLDLRFLEDGICNLERTFNIVKRSPQFQLF